MYNMRCYQYLYIYIHIYLESRAFSVPIGSIYSTLLVGYLHRQ